MQKDVNAFRSAHQDCCIAVVTSSHTLSVTRRYLALFTIICISGVHYAFNSGLGNRWCKREYVEHKALKEWKFSILKLVNKRISFYSQNTNLLPPKSKTSLRHLKLGIQEFHKKYVLAPADKAANNVVVF